jgi:hypothetical protein
MVKIRRTGKCRSGAKIASERRIALQGDENRFGIDPGECEHLAPHPKLLCGSERQ